jgi:hypothetical protein
VTHLPAQGGSHRSGTCLPDAGRGHAEVLSLHHHTDALWAQPLLEAIGHLHGQAVLDLEVAGEEVQRPRQLGQAEDALPGQVAEMGDSV